MELRSELSKQYIAEALLLLMKNHDYNKISIQNIVDKAGLSRMAFYRNFSDKDDILNYYLDKITANFVNSNKAEFTPQTMPEAFEALFVHLYRYLEIGKLLHKNNKLHLAQVQFDKYFQLKAKSEEDRHYRLYVSGGTFRLYCDWVENGAQHSPKEMAHYICQLI